MDRGSSLAIIAIRFPTAINSSLELPSGDYWTELPNVMDACPKCGGRSMTLLRVQNFNPLSSILVYCSREHRILKMVDLSHEQMVTVEGAASRFMESIEVSGMELISLEAARSRGLSANPKHASKSITVNPMSIDPLRATVPITEGYRNVAWLRSHEAKAISMAYERLKSIPVNTASGKLVFTAEYSPKSKEGTKLNAQVKGIRVGKNGLDQNIGWVREVEARAVLEALDREELVEILDVELSTSVLVQYFPKGSIEEKTFKSCTRILRKL